LADISRFLRDRYSIISKGDNERIMEAIQKLLSSSRMPGQSLQGFLEETGRMIHRLFDFQEIAIGLRSRRDGLFRYEILIGFREEADKARRRLAYTAEEMTNPEKYPGGVFISKVTEFQIVELQPYREGEEDTYNRPSMIKKSRNAPDDFIEGDYIDVYMYGRENDIIGWIELSATRSGKLPDRNTIKWLELISSILAMAICERDTARQIC